MAIAHDKTLDGTGLSVWIDTYDDIFSDFDPRPFGERTVSDDFIHHVRKISRDFKGRVSNLRILVPAALRNDLSEKAIAKRIQDHFSKTHDALAQEGRTQRARGVYFVLGGFLSMAVTGYLNYQKDLSFYAHLALALFEPGGWFLFWTGLDQLINFSRMKRVEIDFYRKLFATHVDFRAY